MFLLSHKRQLKCDFCCVLILESFVKFPTITFVRHHGFSATPLIRYYIEKSKPNLFIAALDLQVNTVYTFLENQARPMRLVKD